MKMKTFLFCLTLLLNFLLALGCSEFGNNKSSTPTDQPHHQPDSSFNEENPFESGNEPSPDLNSETEQVFSERNLLLHIGVNIILPNVRNFRIQAAMLNTKTEAYCSDLVGPENSMRQALDVQNQWKETMLSYHRLNAAPIGPLTDKGRELADNIYAWPYINLCGIDIQVEKRARTGSNDEKLLTSVKGLGALEYLFFEPELKTQCNPNNASLKPVHDWAQKSPLQKQKDRCAFAHHLSQDLLKHSLELEKRWDDRRGNFSKTLVDGTRYKTLKEAINALSDSLFSLEQVKDNRLGKPLGLHKDCLEAAGKCPDLAEHRWSGIALEAIEAQARGFQNIFWGIGRLHPNGLGFDDYLEKMNRKDIAENMEKKLSQVLGSLKETLILGNFQSQISAMNPEDCKATTTTDRRVPVCALFQEVRILTTKMKTEFLMALSLQVPPTYQGDND